MGLGNMGERTEGIRKQEQELIEQAYQRGYKAGREEGFKNGFDEGASHPNINIIEEWIEQGRNEAWEAARRIMSQNGASWGIKDMKEIFGFSYSSDVMLDLSASEAIEKIREYEEKKQEKYEIKVGDEVIYHDDKGVVVLVANNGKAISIMSVNGGWMIRADSENLVKTGRTFPEIEEVLKKMQEGE